MPDISIKTLQKDPKGFLSITHAASCKMKEALNTKRNPRIRQFYIKSECRKHWFNKEQNKAFMAKYCKSVSENSLVYINIS